MEPSIEEIRKKLEKIYSETPSKKIGFIYEYEGAHRIWVVNKFGNFVKYFEDSYDFFADLVHSLNYVPKKDWGWKRNLQYAYFGAATRPLFKAFTLLFDGFYDEATTVVRKAYELLIKIVFCSCYPRDIWSTYAEPEKGRRQFNLTNFLRDDLKVDWRFLYGLSSGSAHGKLYLTKIVEQMRKGKSHEPIGLWLKPDEKMITVPINQLTFLIWAYIRLLVELFPMISLDLEENGRLKVRAKDFDDALGSIVKTMPNKLKEVGRDFEKVVEIVKAAEGGCDWKKLT